MRVTVTPEQIRSAFEAVKDDPSFDESRGLWERGQPPVEMIQAMCLRPEILRAFAGFGNCVYPGGLLERRVKELVIITASTDERLPVLRELTLRPGEHRGHRREPAGRDRRAPTSLAPRERLAVEYTRAAMPTRTPSPRRSSQRAARAVHRSGARRAHRS